MRQNKSKHIYPVELEKEILKQKFIPRRIRYNENLKLYHRYWIPYYEGIIKIMDITEYDGKKFYHIKFGNNMNAIDTHPLNYDQSYELLHDRDEIETKNIINDTESYTGAEIKFWFVMRQIDFDKPKYKGFWNFFDPNLNNLLIDTKYYFVSYDTKTKDKYQIKLDRSKL